MSSFTERLRRNLKLCAVMLLFGQTATYGLPADMQRIDLGGPGLGFPDAPGSVLDCDPDGGDTPGTNCEWTSVGSISAEFVFFAWETGDPDGLPFPTSRGTNCTGQLIQKDSKKFVVLTAAHCTSINLGFLFFENFGFEGAPGDDPENPMFGIWGIIDSYTVTFDRINTRDPDRHIRGGKIIRVPQFYDDYDAVPEQGINQFFAGLDFERELDTTLIVFPRDATTASGQTIDDLWPGIKPITTLADYDVSINELIDERGNFEVTHVAYGRPNLDQRRIGPEQVNTLFGNFLLVDQVTEGGPGDSGSGLYINLGDDDDDDGESRVMIGVQWGNTVDEAKLEAAGFPLPFPPLGVYSRLDHPNFKDLIQCMRQYGEMNYAQQLKRIQTCACKQELRADLEQGPVWNPLSGEFQDLERGFCRRGIGFGDLDDIHGRSLIQLDGGPPPGDDADDADDADDDE